MVVLFHKNRGWENIEHVIKFILKKQQQEMKTKKSHNDRPLEPHDKYSRIFIRSIVFKLRRVTSQVIETPFSSLSSFEWINLFFHLIVFSFINSFIMLATNFYPKSEPFVEMWRFKCVKHFSMHYKQCQACDEILEHI